MKLFDNVSKSEERQKELELQQLRIQLETERQKSLEKKLDDLILVGKAIYTILKQEHEERKAAYENLENVIQAAASEIIQTQEKAMKVMVAYGREDNQKVMDTIGTISEEIAKVQSVSEDAQKNLLAAAEELNSSILDNTSVLSNKLSVLEGSIKDINISVEAAPVMPVSVPVMAAVNTDIPEVSLDYEEEASEEVVTLEEDLEIGMLESDIEEALEDIQEETEPDLMFMPEMEEELSVEEDIMSVFEQEEESVEEFVIPEPELEEVMDEEEPGDIFAVLEEELEEMLEAEPIPEPVPAPVMDDPNRAMTPDEIAALIASMN